MSPDLGQRGPGVAELDRQAPAVLLLEPVGVAAGERLDQRRLAVVDVSRGGDDVHHPSPGTGQYRAARRTALTSDCVVLRGNGDQVEQQPAALDVARRPGARCRAAAVRPDRAGRATAALSIEHAGCTSAADRCRRRHGLDVDLRCQRVGDPPRPLQQLPRGEDPSAAATGAAGPVRVASRAARVSLSTRSARANGWRRSDSTRSERPSISPH